MSLSARRVNTIAALRSSDVIVVAMAKRPGDLVALTYPACRHLLQGHRDDVIAIEATAAGQARPVGLALGLIGVDRRIELLSVFVEIGFRGKGVGGALTKAFIGAARHAGARGLDTSYQTGTGFSDAFERILSHARWEPPSDRMLVVRCRVADLADGSWRRAISRAEGAFVCSAWAEVDADSRDALRVACSGDPKVAAIDPTRFDTGCDTDSSLAAWSEGQVIGWCVTHRFGTMLRVTCAGALAHSASTVIGILMYDKMVQQARDVGVEELMWTVPLEYRQYARLIERRVRPIATLFERVRVARCELAAVIHEESAHGQEADYRQAV